MKFLKYLNEQYLGMFVWSRPDYGGRIPIAAGPPDYPVFLNPDKKEMREVHKDTYARFLLDVRNSNLYVWNSNILHQAVAGWLEKQGASCDYPSKSLDQYIWGTSIIEGNVKAVGIEKAAGRRKQEYEANKHTIDLLSKWFDKDSINDCLEPPKKKKKKQNETIKLYNRAIKIQ